MLKIQCPECGAMLGLPDEIAGRRVRCNKCSKDFVAGPSTARPSSTSTALPKSVPPPPPLAGSRTSSTGTSLPKEGVPPPPPIPSLRKSSSTTAVQKNARAITVVARGTGSGGARPGWIAASLAAFLLPVFVAAGFVAFNWHSRKAAPPGKLYAAIKIGSTSGVQYGVFDVYEHERLGYDYRVALRQDVKTTMVKGMDKTGKFDPEGLRNTIDAIRRCYEKLTEEDKIPSERVFIVGSGGLFGAIRTNPRLTKEQKEKLIEQNQAALTTAIKDATGKTMDIIDVEDEAVYEFEGIVEPDNLSRGIYIDVGGGGTRGGYLTESGKVKPMEIASYTKFAATVNRQRGVSPFAVAAGKSAEQELRKPLRGQIKADPQLQERNVVYVAGGIVWMMATCTHPRECSGSADILYVNLTAKDIDTFLRKVSQNADYLETYKPNEELSPEEAKALESDLKKMRKIFNGDARIAGAQILKSLSVEMNYQDKTLRFHRYSNVAWMMAYIARHSNLKRGTSK